MQFDSKLIQDAWRVRARNFPPSVTFHCPVSTRSVSVTGDQCALQCAHCGGRFLKKMLPWEKFKNTIRDVVLTGKEPEIKSCLISGGCDSRGRVPFYEHVKELKQIKSACSLRYNFHVGLVDESEARLLKGLADVVSFDFTGADRTINNVLGLPGTVEDYASTYKVLKRNVPVVPHICIGIDGGKIVGEYRALDLLAEIGTDALVFIVFIPTPGTAFACKMSPSLDEVVNLLACARLIFSDIPIHLGCMRPGGWYREQLDSWALRCGINHLVMPSRRAAAEAESLGLMVNHRKECCVL